MKFHKKNIIFVIIFSLFLPALVFAAPSINSAPGTISDDSTVTINGSGFGAKLAASPFIWDTFEDGTDNTQATIGTWPVVSGRDHYINSDNNRDSISSYNVRCNFKGSLGSGGNDCYFSTNTGSSKWYVSYWVKLASDFTWGTRSWTTGSPYGGENNANIKFIRFWPISGTPNENVVMVFHSFSTPENAETVAGVEYVDPVFNQEIPYPFNPVTGISKGVWHHMQFEYAENSGADAPDGALRWWFDGALKFEKTDLNTRDDNLNDKYAFIIGLYDSWDDNSINDNYVYLDDIYADKVWLRVEIGDAPTYSASAHREMQIPVSWSDDSITFTVNQGSFTNSQTAYLYVVDQDGNVNTNGYPVTIGGSASDTTPPAAPTGVTVN